ncbi:MAG TPA: GNAT family N-acetyltransferase [Solirubrobacteraceae bacterium]|nr:GNAT family N-acetyltransferase [Solirubrobacteraceae bacterium]
MTSAPVIGVVGEDDLAELLPLMRAYCDFYEVAPTDEALLAMSRALIADADREGVQLLARGPDAAPVGFATVFWTWSTTRAARIGVMNDLFVAPKGRGGGVADALIAACVERCRERGAVALTWQTALDNARAQAVYDRVGARRSQWLDYDLPIA